MYLCMLYEQTKAWDRKRIETSLEQWAKKGMGITRQETLNPNKRPNPIRASSLPIPWSGPFSYQETFNACQ